MNRFYVIDEANQPSWDGKTETAESFKSQNKARTRALGLANDNPGEAFTICEAIEIAQCSVPAAALRVL